jgi:redox-sensitive bicupin YhaK (pirin superfamily)
MDDPVRQTVPLGPQWPCIDPFLFCAHHDDAYPSANAAMGPDASLEGREIGQDFAGIDGWRMYHGDTVPGFPAHPHRGFETVTYVRKGLIDHADSLGAAARFGRGDVQWLTAGKGIQHAEMFPLMDRKGPNPLELFQIWLNLPAESKLADPSFTMFADAQVPKLVVRDGDGPATTVTVIAGALPGAVPPAPPPDSWAARADSEVAIWHLVFEPGARWTMPRAAVDVVRTLYVFDGESLTIAGHDGELGRDTGVLVRSDVPVELSSERGVEVLVLAGRPIGEPVAQYGPFVMNTEAEIRQAFADYEKTGFGGWPWDEAGPVHPADQGRFARHIDGTVEDLEPEPELQDATPARR